MLFLSYAREDYLMAEQLQAQLTQQGIACFKDPVLPSSACFWREEVREQLLQCSAMIALESPWAEASPWVDEERRAFSGPILSVPAGGMAATRPGGGSTPVTRRELFHCIQQMGLARPTSAASESLPKIDEDSARRQRAETVRESIRWLDSFRLEFGRRRASLVWDGNDFVNSRDESRLRAVPACADTYLGTSPVSNMQYATFLGVTDLPEPPTWTRAAYRCPDAPVTGVTWFEASAYAAWAGGSLPTEAEWESAAKGGVDAVAYATANGEIEWWLAWFERPFAAAEPRPARDFSANAAGFFGLSGNTWDWTGAAWNQHRVIKGGGCMDAARFCRIAARYRNAPVDRDSCVGFRIRVVRPKMS